jgi:hypothetical protein
VYSICVPFVPIISLYEKGLAIYAPSTYRSECSSSCKDIVITAQFLVKFTDMKFHDNPTEDDMFHVYRQMDGPRNKINRLCVGFRDAPRTGILPKTSNLCKILMV